MTGLFLSMLRGRWGLYRFHSYLNRFESLESLEFSVFFCGALDRNMIRFGYLIREDRWSSALKNKSGN